MTAPTPKPSASEKAMAQLEADEKAAAVTASTAPAAEEPTTARRGVYVVFNSDDAPVTAFSAEIKAMRRAMAEKGSVRFVVYGDPFV